MLSMSSGFRSAMRLTPLSWFEEFRPPAEAVTALSPFWITEFEIATPSTT